RKERDKECGSHQMNEKESVDVPLWCRLAVFDITLAPKSIDDQADPLKRVERDSDRQRQVEQRGNDAICAIQRSTRGCQDQRCEQPGVFEKNKHTKVNHHSKHGPGPTSMAAVRMSDTVAGQAVNGDRKQEQQKKPRICPGIECETRQDQKRHLLR